MGEQLELFEKTSEKTPGKEKTRPEARAQKEDLRRPWGGLGVHCSGCGSTTVWGQSYYACPNCMVIRERR